MTRPTDPRGAARRGADNQDTGYTLDAPRVVRGKRWPAPADIRGINRYQRQRQTTGCCVVCGKQTDALGVTCKATACVACWVFGHDEAQHEER